MSKLNDLILQYCPDGVEWKTLGEVCEVIKGQGLSKEDKGAGDIPIILYGELYTTYGNYIQRVVSSTSLERIGKAPKILNGDLLLPLSSTTKEAQIGKVSTFNLDTETYLGGDALILRHNQNSGYLTHLMNGSWFEGEKMKCVKGTTINHLDYHKMMKISIPLPPLPVQEEIVRILDNFSLLSAELEAELEGRRKQYDFYRTLLLDFSEGKKQAYEGQSDPRNRLLSFDANADSGSVQWKALGEIASVTKLAGFEFSEYMRYSDTGNIIALRGLNVKDGHLVLNDVKYVDRSDFSKLNRSKLYRNDLLYTYVGTVGQVGLVDANDKYYLAPNVALIRVKDENQISPKFLVYFLLSPSFKSLQLERLTAASSMKNITMEKIRTFSIPIPPLAEQQRIVDILDRFDTLTNDLSAGLPAEIEARKKQYEHYRDKLLTFKRKGE